MLSVREYGNNESVVYLLHGGPGAAGYVAPVACDLADKFKIIEPFQRGSDTDKTVSVSQHVEDLREVVEYFSNGKPAAIVGHSWGAMLALCFAAAYPQKVSSLALVGTGTFDTESRNEMNRLRAARTDEKLMRRFERLEEQYTDPDKRLAAMGRLYQIVDSYELGEVKNEVAKVDIRAHKQTWADMIALQRQGVYPRSFTNIQAPAVMLHGADDPHPGRMIYVTLKAYMPHLEYVEFEKCGHYPWLEKHAMNDFYEVLSGWLGDHQG